MSYGHHLPIITPLACYDTPCLLWHALPIMTRLAYYDTPCLLWHALPIMTRLAYYDTPCLLWHALPIMSRHLPAPHCCMHQSVANLAAHNSRRLEARLARRRVGRAGWSGSHGALGVISETHHGSDFWWRKFKVCIPNGFVLVNIGYADDMWVDMVSEWMDRCERILFCVRCQMVFPRRILMLLSK